MQMVGEHSDSKVDAVVEYVYAKNVTNRLRGSTAISSRQRYKGITQRSTVYPDMVTDAQDDTAC